MTVRVLLVEDHQLMAQSLQVALRAEGMTAVRAPLDDVEAVLACARELEPQVVLLDLDLRGRIGDGVVLVAPLVALGAQVVVVSGSEDRVRVAQAVEAGAIGCVSKAEDVDVLLGAVQDAAAMQELLTPVQRTMLLLELHRQRQEHDDRMAPFRSLTPRERDVLRAMMDGQAASAIAKAVFVSEATVRTQIRSVLAKLRVNSQLEAVAAARRAGWSPEP